MNGTTKKRTACSQADKKEPKDNMSLNCTHNAIYIIKQWETYRRQRIPESNCPRNKIVDIGILITRKNDDNLSLYQSKTYRKDIGWLYF